MVDARFAVTMASEVDYEQALEGALEEEVFSGAMEVQHSEATLKYRHKKCEHDFVIISLMTLHSITSFDSVNILCHYWHSITMY